jgi:hypothetical protein
MLFYSYVLDEKVFTNDLNEKKTIVTAATAAVAFFFFCLHVSDEFLRVETGYLIEKSSFGILDAYKQTVFPRYEYAYASLDALTV